MFRTITLTMLLLFNSALLADNQASDKQQTLIRPTPAANKTATKEKMTVTPVVKAAPKLERKPAATPRPKTDTNKQVEQPTEPSVPDSPLYTPPNKDKKDKSFNWVQ